MRTNLAIGCGLVTLAVVAFPSIARAQAYPRTLVATAEASGASGALMGTLTIRIESLMHDDDFKKVADALRFGGYPKFLPALRQLPPIGYVRLGDRQVDLKYAHARSDGKPGLVLGTDQPIYFVGAGAPDAKPKAGYEVGVIEIDVDAKGNGKGTMAGAARVKPAADGGVVIDDYAITPVRLSIKPGP